MGKFIYAACAAVVLLGSGVLLEGCNLFGSADEKGGAGADFDASQYYTKAQIDLMLHARPQMFNANSTDGVTIMGTGFDNHSTTWTTPANLDAAVIVIELINNSSEIRTLKLTLSTTAGGHSSDIEITLPANGKFSMPIFWRYFSSEPTSLKLWLKEGNATGMTISGRPFYWFAGAKGL